MWPGVQYGGERWGMKHSGAKRRAASGAASTDPSLKAPGQAFLSRPS